MNAATREADPFAIIDQDPDPIHEKRPDSTPSRKIGSGSNPRKTTRICIDPREKHGSDRQEK